MRESEKRSMHDQQTHESHDVAFSVDVGVGVADVAVVGNDDVQSGTFSLPFWKLKNANLFIHGWCMYSMCSARILSLRFSCHKVAMCSTICVCNQRMMIHFACAILKFKFIQQKYN